MKLNSFPSWVARGRKVVCVNDNDGIFRFPGVIYKTNPLEIVAGKVYTIRDLCLDKSYSRMMDTTYVQCCLLLEEIARMTEYHIVDSAGTLELAECGFNVERFRPLITTEEEDVAMIKGLLDKEKILEEV